MAGVPQDSILVFLFGICLYFDMFFNLQTKYFVGYTLFVVRDNIKSVISALKNSKEQLFTLSSNNEMELNVDKCHVLLSIQKVCTKC